MLTRRSLVGVAVASAGGFAAAKPEPRNRTELGFHVVEWGTSENSDQRRWERAVIDLHSLGVRRVSVVTYRYVDAETGRVTKRSKHRLPLGTTDAALARALEAAGKLGVDAAIYPLLEIDAGTEPGDIWRGGLTLDQNTLQTFFSSYSTYILEMAALAYEHGSRRQYVGSELSGLTRNPAAIGHWKALIGEMRRNGSSSTLIYAAHHDEYQQVPFWGELDHIGINAYFPLVTPSEAAGHGHPGVSLIQRRWEARLARLAKFSRDQRKPISFSEWGTVPLDLTTVRPWDDKPSIHPDPAEQINAYSGLLSAILEAGDWLTAIDFWHWRLPKSGGSNYAVDLSSPIAEIVRRYSADKQ